MLPDEVRDRVVAGTAICALLVDGRIHGPGTNPRLFEVILKLRPSFAENVDEPRGCPAQVLFEKSDRLERAERLLVPEQNVFLSRNTPIEWPAARLKPLR